MPSFPVCKSAQALAQFLGLDSNSPQRAYFAHHLLHLKGGVPREVASKPSLFIQTPWRTRDSRLVICSLPPWADKEAPMNSRIGALVLLALLVLLTGCGGGGTGGGTTNPIVVSISPSTANLNQGATLSFTASVPVNWAVQEGAAGGSITNMGAYSAPNKAGTFHVIAISQADTTQTATATVTVATLVVSIIPPSGVLGPLGVLDFSAKVNTSLNPSVTWSVQETAGGTTTTAGGQYTAPNTTGGPFHVVATSAQDTSKNAIANVTI